MKPNLNPFAWLPPQVRKIPNDIGARRNSVVPASMVPPAGTGASAANAPAPPVATYSPGSYGEAVTVPIVFAVAGAQLALARPSNGIRKLLIINNTIAGFAITIGYDAPPAAASGLQIASGGNLFFDIVVPQNDVWIFAPAAGTVQLIFMTDNLSGA